MNRARFQLRHDQVVVTQNQQGLNQRTRLLPGRHQQRRFSRNLLRDIDGFTGQYHEAGDILRLVRQVAFQHL